MAVEIRAWRKKNQKLYRSKLREYHKRESSELTDNYIRRAHFKGMDKVDPALIEAKRAHLQLIRVTRKKE